ncbi:MAG: DNA polymerase III, partial [Candidatus Heimdallarchaeaceae archaeon]
GITSEDIKNTNYDFPTFCKKIKERIPHLKDYTWGSWGDYDRRQFERNCKLYRVPYSFGATHINIKNLFALKYKLKKEVGMMKALEVLGLPHFGTHHNGLDDAINIANILREIL